MYSNEAEPTDAELELAGLRREDLEAATCIEIWPENARAYHLFSGMGTQWQLASMGGPIGLNFMVAYARMDRMGLTPEEYNQLDEDLQLMESVALQAMRAKE